jgi:hypothetical protein
MPGSKVCYFSTHKARVGALQCSQALPLDPKPYTCLFSHQFFIMELEICLQIPFMSPRHTEARDGC